MKAKSLALALLPGLLVCALAVRAETPPRQLPPPAAVSQPAGAGLRTVVFSGGCFWGVQGVFSHVHGVTRAVSGYTGGAALTAHYEMVGTGLTGHAEAVKVTYDPRQVSYGDLLRVFFSVALDPTEVNRQGPDEGSQYRSVVWVSSGQERGEAEAYVRLLDARHAFAKPIATRVQPLSGFYPAETYHQDFMARHPDSPYILAWDVDKVAALHRLYPALFAAKPAVGV